MNLPQFEVFGRLLVARIEEKDAKNKIEKTDALVNKLKVDEELKGELEEAKIKFLYTNPQSNADEEIYLTKYKNLGVFYYVFATSIVGIYDVESDVFLCPKDVYQNLISDLGLVKIDFPYLRPAGHFCTWLLGSNIYSTIKYDDYIVKEADTRVPTIGVRSFDCLVYCSKHAANFKHLRVLRKESSVTPQRINMILSFYFNAYYALMPAKIFDEGARRRKELHEAGIINRVYFSEDDVTTWLSPDHRISNKDLIKAAFIGVAAPAKRSSGGEDAATDVQDNVSKWLWSRIDALFITIGYPAPKLTENIFGRDLLVVAKYLDDILEVRKLITSDVISTTDTTLPPIWKAFKKYVSTILSYAGMTTMQVAYQFGSNPTTAAHTLLPVVNQTKKLIADFKTIQTKVAEQYKIEYMYLQDLVAKEFEVATFPDLAYCALYKKKSAALNTSWDNYVRNITNTECDVGELQRKTALDLIDTADTGAVDSTCLKFLEEHGKKYVFDVHNVKVPVPVKGLGLLEK